MCQTVQCPRIRGSPYSDDLRSGWSGVRIPAGV